MSGLLRCPPSVEVRGCRSFRFRLREWNLLVHRKSDDDDDDDYDHDNGMYMILDP